ncbi:formylglycine-generating enzyme family protein [Hymenobacter sp. BT175]|uniref:SUMF1/EgtB/PvdO family nonheme iron enzyme n=1 Tax=Hymenobacter translucens TaxID=2886507 RepID=UPI001D0F35BA|nr:SUMF1/EgtB/PvdO family nonheme iron enzyme [Hymenobacter translucens]MCC2545439.1 formylglycine-generating enzyme family protein [Hymenobacter translucens]
MITRSLLLTLTILLFLLPRPTAAQSAADRKRGELLRAVDAPGVKQVQDSLFMDETEVANIHWLEYLFFVRRDSSEAFYRTQLPDSSGWSGRLRIRTRSGRDSAVSYLRFPQFRYYPVVGISYQQAVNYCKWRTRVVRTNLLQSKAYQRSHRQLRHYDVHVTYRLPTPAEWEMAATGGLSPTEFPLGPALPAPTAEGRRKGRALAKNGTYADCLARQSLGYAPTDLAYELEFNVVEDFYLETLARAVRCQLPMSFEPEDQKKYPAGAYGLRNLIGNVAELTSTQGVAKGGSYGNSVRDFTLRTDFSYSQPQPWLGFRCAAIVRVKKKN